MEQFLQDGPSKEQFIILAVNMSCDQNVIVRTVYSRTVWRNKKNKKNSQMKCYEERKN